MKIQIIIFATLFIFLASCSSVHVIKGPSSHHDHVGTSIDDFKQNEKKQEENKDNESTPIKEESVRVGENGGTTFTPTGEAPNTHLDRKIRIGLSFGPGLYRTLNYLSVLKVLERQGISPDIVTGTGIGAVIAGMYASGMTPESIEWNIFKYLKEKKAKRPFEKNWIEEIDQFFLYKLKDQDIAETKKKFFITLYNHTTKKTYFFNKGNLRNLLLLNLRLSNNTLTYATGEKYSTAFETEIFNARLLTMQGADITIAIDSLGKKMDLEAPNEFLFGVFSKAGGKIQKEKKDFDFFITLPLEKYSLDVTTSLSMSMQQTIDYINKWVPLIKKKVLEKKEQAEMQNELE